MNTELIHTFYTAFKNQDAEKMIECYHEDIIFEDPAFGKLHGERAKNMWRMLCENAKDFNLEFSNIRAIDQEVKAHWEAKYNFSQTNRPVHNRIDATFEFKDGKISKHTDVFDLHQWAKQALGFKGFLLGSTSFFKTKLQQQTNQKLDAFGKRNVTKY